VVTDPTRICELLLGLPDVRILGVEDIPGGPLIVSIEQTADRPACVGCGDRPVVMDRDWVSLIDLPAFGRRTTLRWSKVRWECTNQSCAMRSWTWMDPRIAAAQQRMTDRAGRWATLQVGYHGRSVSEVAHDLGCDWHTIMDAVIAYGEPLVDDPGRIGDTDALGLDETLFCKTGRYRTQNWSTSIVDVRNKVLLDVVEGRGGIEPCRWIDARPPAWRHQIRWATLDMSGPYKAVFDTMLPDAEQIADPFHFVKLANDKLDLVRRRVQNDTTGHRGRKHDPLYRARRLLVRADDRLDERGRTKLVGLLNAGDPKGEVRMAWHAKEVCREVYSPMDFGTALEFVTRLAADLQDDSCPPEINQLGRTVHRWRMQIANWHKAHLTNGPTETMNNLIKRIKRVAFGLVNFRHHCVRSLLYAGKPNWDLLATITPR
jgi:transposase